MCLETSSSYDHVRLAIAKSARYSHYGSSDMDIFYYDADSKEYVVRDNGSDDVYGKFEDFNAFIQAFALGELYNIDYQ